jgi:hypothetical protein
MLTTKDNWRTPALRTTMANQDLRHNGATLPTGRPHPMLETERILMVDINSTETDLPRRGHCSPISQGITSAHRRRGARDVSSTGREPRHHRRTASRVHSPASSRLNSTLSLGGDESNNSRCGANRDKVGAITSY